MVRYGYPCDGFSNETQGITFTYINLTDIITQNGTITNACIYSNGSIHHGTGSIAVLAGDLVGNVLSGGNLYVKVFRDDGTNYLYIGQIACGTSPSGNVNSVNTGSSVRQAGDITSDTLKTAWTSVTTRILATVSNGQMNVYVNSSSGSDTNGGTSCADAVLTFSKVDTLLDSDGGDIYICDNNATFSTESVSSSKPYKIKQGAVGVSNVTLPRLS